LEADTPPDAITADLIRDFLNSELERNSPTTAQHSYCALRAFFAYLESEGFVSDNPMTRVAKPKRKQSVIPTLNQSQVEALLAICGRDFYVVPTCVGVTFRSHLVAVHERLAYYQ
jgi:site-specific recombinase XerD